MFVLIAMIVEVFAEKVHGSVHVNFGIKLVVAGAGAGVGQHIICLTYIVELALGIDPVVKVFVGVIHVGEPVIRVFDV